nr:LacI-transcription regulator [Hydrogenophaga sp.]
MRGRDPAREFPGVPGTASRAASVGGALGVPAEKPMKKTTPTIEDVARVAGVSISTVSNVLNRREGRMRADTLERVRKAIDDLGFRPNQSARHLKTGHMAMIGLLVPSIANPFFGTLARWIEAVANERGYGVMLCNTQREAARELAYAQALMALGVRGVVIGSALQAQEHLSPLIERGLAVVSFDRTAREATSTMDYVSVDNHRCGSLAAEHLLALGHRELAYVTAPLRAVSRSERLEGVRQACRAAGAHLQVHTASTPLGQIDMEMTALGHAAAVALQASDRVPTGYIAMNDLVAVGLLSGLEQCGRRVPQDVSVMGIDNLFLDSFLRPGLTSIGHPTEQLATAAIDCLLARIHNPDALAHERVFLPELIQRGTTAPRAKALNLESINT